MNDYASSLRTFLSSRQKEIADAHQRGASGFETCSSLSGMMDELLGFAYEGLPSSSSRAQVAIIAIGGYGRAELCPRSDTDIMVLCSSGGAKSGAEQVAKEFLHLLWDAGIDVGHSVRTIEEAIALYGQSLESWASMIESRYICGNEELAQSFFNEMKRRIAAPKDHWFIEGVFGDIASRHERYGNSVKLLEPNIKKSAGGLRDFQAIFWLFRANEPGYLADIDGNAPASKSFLDALLDRQVIGEEEHCSVLEAMQFLFRVRHEMHYRRKTLTDGLEYILQREVAEGLGYGGKAELHSVEVFMREYYLHARTIFRLNQQLTQRFREMVEPVRHAVQGGEKIGELFYLHDGVLSLDPGVNQFSSARDLFDAFVFAAEREGEMDFRLRATIERSLPVITDETRASKDLASAFRRILNSRRVAPTLHDMNELGVLGSYIPEFGELVAFFQHNVYHYFTADEHTLIAIASAERLREEQGVMREVFRNLRRKDVLYLAILLHDIAKPRGVADHEVTGVAMARDVLTRLEMGEAFPDVAFLVRNHLVMEQIAFRRNIHDPETIKEFAARFERPEQLDYLYLLTYADLSAVNINVWTDWKSSLLQELYQLTSEVLRRKLVGAQIDEYQESKHEAAVETLVDKLGEAHHRDDVHRHLSGIQNNSYVSLFTEEEISQHIHKTASDETVSTLFKHREGYTEITVIADDAPFALSKFCAVLAANDANIFDANIFTRDDGIIIDRFRVSDATTKQQLDQRVCSKVAQNLSEVMEGKLDIEHLFEAHRRKWKRRPKQPVNPNIRTGVEFEDNPRFTIIDVYAPDSLGFLYKVTETISRVGLDIYFAKIATRVDGIVDAFYTLDRGGNPVTDPERRETIRREILSTITSLAEQQLA